MEQNCINKRSGRKCQDFEKAEKDFQRAQVAWKANQNDKKAWDKMFLLIQTAVFNYMNKDLEFKLDKETIEERSLDITCNIMQSLINKRNKGLDWEIKKVSSFVGLPCMARFKESYKNWDKTLGEDSFITLNEDGKEVMMEYEDSVMKNGIYYLHEGSNIYTYGDENNE